MSSTLIPGRTELLTPDFDQLCEWERSLGIDSRRTQLSRGSGIFAAECVDFGKFFIWRYREPHRMHHRFALPPGSFEYCFAVFEQPVMWCGRQIPGSAVILHRGGEEYECVIPNCGSLYGLVFHEDDARNFGLLDTRLVAYSSSKSQAVAGLSHQLMKGVTDLFDPYFGSEITELETFEPIYSRLLRRCNSVATLCFPDKNIHCPLARRRLISQARDLIVANLSTPLNMQEIANELGVNRRSLERAFQRHLGLTPYQFLLIERLHVARQMLKRGDKTVLACSIQAGFDDASRFSKMYVRHFGELPSQTRGRD